MTDAPAVIVSLSRLMSRVRMASPTGVDRVEFAYARHLIARGAAVAGYNPMFRRYGRISARHATRYLDALERRWSGGDDRSRIWRDIADFWWMIALAPLPVPRSGGARVYVQASHSDLLPVGRLARILRREGAQLVCMVHDLIPMSFPEYARPGEAAAHALRLQVLEEHATVLLANSEATGRAIGDRLGPGGPEIVVAHLGVTPAARAAPSAIMPRPYFVCLGTIEPRKNHLLLFAVWRRLADRLGDAAPQLHVVGRRGWENENVVDQLERSPLADRLIFERPDLSDAEVATLLSGARALVMPSFAEGFGLPVAEALAAGVPVLCSDLDVLREVGGDVPDYLDPLDGLAWLAMLEAYAADPAPQRDAQLRRLTAWRPPTWDRHLAIVDAVIARVARSDPAHRAADDGE